MRLRAILPSRNDGGRAFHQKACHTLVNPSYPKMPLISGHFTAWESTSQSGIRRRRCRRKCGSPPIPPIRWAVLESKVSFLEDGWFSRRRIDCRAMLELQRNLVYLTATLRLAAVCKALGPLLFLHRNLKAYGEASPGQTLRKTHRPPQGMTLKSSRARRSHNPQYAR